MPVPPRAENPPRTQEQLKQTLPKVEIVVLPRAGHYPHREVPDTYVRIVKLFVSSLS